MDNIHANWEDTPEVAMALELSDPGQPYSCAAWGNQFNQVEPLIVHGGSPYYDWWGMFETTYVPAHAFIDHNMKVYYKTNTLGSYTANNKIEEMLEDCGECYIDDVLIDDGGSSSQSYQGFCCEEFGGTYFDDGDWDEFYCEGSDAIWLKFCGNPDGDNDGFNTDNDNCPNDYNPSQSDADNDGLGDACDDCINLPGDPNDDMIIDILDIVTVVNMVLTGGTNSPDFTDCEKTDADMTGDGIINILDVIQIINAVLGNLDQFVSSNNYIDVTSDIKGNDLYLTFTSDIAVGLELRIIGGVSNINLVDNTNSFTLSKNMENINKVALIYSMQNKTFDNSLTLQIVDGANLDTDSDISIIAGNVAGDKMSVRWLDGRNFSITSLYPNPFNPVTQIDYSVDQAGDLRLSIYNILGQEVAVLHNGYQTEGNYQAVWNAGSLASGVYYIKMMMHGQVETKKAVLIK